MVKSIDYYLLQLYYICIFSVVLLDRSQHLQLQSYRVRPLKRLTHYSGLVQASTKGPSTLDTLQLELECKCNNVCTVQYLGLFSYTSFVLSQYLQVFLNVLSGFRLGSILILIHVVLVPDVR